MSLCILHRLGAICIGLAQNYIASVQFAAARRILHCLIAICIALAQFAASRRKLHHDDVNWKKVNFSIKKAVAGLLGAFSAFTAAAAAAMGR